MHRCGDPGGGPATIAVRSAIRRDYSVIDLRTLRYAVREQHLDATHTYRQTPPCSGWGDQFRTHRPVRGGFAGCGIHHRIFRPHGVGSDSPPAQARPRAPARLSSPARSESAARRAEGFCLSEDRPTVSFKTVLRLSKMVLRWFRQHSAERTLRLGRTRRTIYRNRRLDAGRSSRAWSSSSGRGDVQTKSAPLPVLWRTP